MTNLIFVVLMQLAAGDVAAAPVGAPAPVAAPAPVTAPAAAPAPAARQPRVCSRVEGTNSRLSRRACYRPVSEEEVAQRQQNAQNWMREMQGPQNAIIPPDGGR